MKTVTVIQFGGKAVEKVVIEDLGDVLLVTTREEWYMAKQQKKKPITVGFKKDYVVPDSHMIQDE